ncbi:MAG: aldo/keto reductase [Candidatus Roizmanbacteria bacterium]|nr:aldo/keto reductase [Candidatus Roizmanbacteria bacterium]
MKYRRLGKTNLQISEIGYGTWGFANDDECWIGATQEESEKSLLYAIDNGLNFIDTARSYGDGLAEEWIGKIIKQRPESNLIIASKILPKNWQWPARKGTDIQEVFPKNHIIEQVNESLKTLDVEELDIMMFHVWQDEWAAEDEWKETIQQLTKEGKVKHWGISTNNHESTNCIEACETGLISVVESIFNLFYQSTASSFLPFAKEHDIGFIARVPLDEGGLTGKITSNTVFPEGDFRSGYFTPDRLRELDKRIAKLTAILKSSTEVSSIADLALRYILHFDEVSTVIPGMRKFVHAQENVSLSDKPKLSEVLIDVLKEHAWNRNFYGGNAWEE